MAPDFSVDAVSEALQDWRIAWESGQVLTPEQLRPDWPQDKLEELRQKIDRRLNLLRRCDDIDRLIPSDTPTSDVPSIPGYTILRFLGKGGQGTVFLAEDSALLRRQVVIKLMNHACLATEEERKRFLREAQSLSDLDHPNIVKIFHADYLGDRPYLVLEYCPGSLSEKIRDGGTLPPKIAARQVMELSDAMDAAHRKGCFHRDLKPDNILLTADGVPKITDFGLAKREDDPGLTRTGHGFGTPGYWAPEQISGDSGATGRHTDVFGLGATLYRLLTGLPPVPRASDITEMLRAYDAIRPIRTIRPDVPRDLEVICLKCLERKPEDRYRTVRDLASDLKRFLEGEPIAARPINTAERFYRVMTQSRLDPGFRHWDQLALFTAIFFFLHAIWTLVTFWLGYPDLAFGVFGGNGIFIIGMTLLLANGLRKDLDKGRQFVIVVLMNIAACAALQSILFGSVVPSYELHHNVWAPHAVINGLAMGLMSLIIDRRFIWAAVFFFMTAIGLSRLPMEWACAGYDLAWVVVLVPLFVAIRRMERSENL